MPPILQNPFAPIEYKEGVSAGTVNKRSGRKKQIRHAENRGVPVFLLLHVLRRIKPLTQKE